MSVTAPRSVSGGSVRCIRPSTVATRIGAFPAARLHSEPMRCCSQPWEANTRSRSCHSRANSRLTSSPSSSCRSPAMRFASFSSAQTIKSGRCVLCRTAAASCARCTPERPDTAMGDVPASSESSSSRTSGRDASASLSLFIPCAMPYPSSRSAQKGRSAAAAAGHARGRQSFYYIGFWQKVYVDFFKFWRQKAFSRCSGSARRSRRR